MSAVHIVLQKEYDTNNRLLSRYFFYTVPEPPAVIPRHAKLVTLQPGEYIDAYECTPSADFTHVDICVYRLSNVDGQFRQELLESFFMEKNK